MNDKNLSKRLSLVAEQIPSGSRLADIGSDHAYLPCYVLGQGIITSAVAGEVNEGPFQSAIEQVKKLNFQEQISVRKGDGLQVVTPGEVDVITIAGMGGPLICTILESGIEKLAGVKRLILQPNVATNQVRKWLEANNWSLINEVILEEDGIIYEILIAENNGENPYSQENYQLELLVGPFLMKRKTTIFRKKWSREVVAWQKILEQFQKAKSAPDVEKKKRLLLEKIKQVEEVLR